MSVNVGDYTRIKSTLNLISTSPTVVGQLVCVLMLPVVVQMKYEPCLTCSDVFRGPCQPGVSRNICDAFAKIQHTIYIYKVSALLKIFRTKVAKTEVTSAWSDYLFLPLCRPVPLNSQTFIDFFALPLSLTPESHAAVFTCHPHIAWSAICQPCEVGCLPAGVCVWPKLSSVSHFQQKPT